MRSTAPARLVVRVKNNRMIRAREEMGFTSQNAACEACGVSQATWNRLECLSMSAFGVDGEPTASAIRIAEFLGVEVRWLFAADGIGCKPVIIPIESPGQLTNGDGAQPEAWLSEFMDRDIVSRLLEAMNPRDRRVVESYFGVGSREGFPPETLDDIAAREGVGRERIRQLRDRGLLQARSAIGEEP